MLKVEQLDISRGGKPLLAALSFSLASGEGLRLVGPNGAGKTSLMRVVAGLAKPDAGLISGDISSKSVRRTDIGSSGIGFSGIMRSAEQTLKQKGSARKSNVLYLGHSSGLNARLTPEENLMWWLSLHTDDGERNNDKKITSAICRDALFAVGLFEQQLSPSGQLSAGQQRRAALARLFLPSECIGQKQLWILDEPFTALDQTFTQRLVERICLHLQQGGCLLLTTHHEIDQLSLKQLDLAQFAPAQSLLQDEEEGR